MCYGHTHTHTHTHTNLVHNAHAWCTVSTYTHTHVPHVCMHVQHPSQHVCTQVQHTSVHMCACKCNTHLHMCACRYTQHTHLHHHIRTYAHTHMQRHACAHMCTHMQQTCAHSPVCVSAWALTLCGTCNLHTLARASTCSGMQTCIVHTWITTSLLMYTQAQMCTYNPYVSLHMFA